MKGAGAADAGAAGVARRSCSNSASRELAPAATGVEGAAWAVVVRAFWVMGLWPCVRHAGHDPSPHLRLRAGIAGKACAPPCTTSVARPVEPRPRLDPAVHVSKQSDAGFPCCVLLCILDDGLVRQTSYPLRPLRARRRPGSRFRRLEALA